MTYHWEAEHRQTYWGPSLWPSMQGESETPGDAARQLVGYGSGGQRYRMVRSDGEVILTVEAQWRTW
jgi:hypothetical protein